MMGMIKHIDQVINDTYRERTPPTDAGLMAEELCQEGYPEAASYVTRLPESMFDDLRWDLEVKQINNDPTAREVADMAAEQELERLENLSDSGYPHYDYEEAYACK